MRIVYMLQRGCRRSTLLLSLALLAAVSAFAQDDAHPGRSIYDEACATCHNDPGTTKAPALDTLKRMRYQTLLYAITQGKMQAQAAGLAGEERRALLEYLVGAEPVENEWIAEMMCPTDRRQPDLKAAATVKGFGFDKRNHRFLSEQQAGLDKEAMGELELAWSLAFPGATTMRSQAAVVGNTLFLPVADLAALFAIDVSGAQPCFHWVYESDTPLRTSAAYGELPDGRQVVVFSDVGSYTRMLDANTGEELWRQYVGVSEFSLTTGTPVVHGERVIVPVSQYEISIGAQPDHLCCTSHGAVVALNSASGEKLWTMHTMPDAEPIRDRGDGQMIWGPSGAPIWNSPAIDEKRNLIFVGTGEATSEPAHENTDAILAINMDDGSIEWSFQATANDIFVGGCGRRGGLNCPKPDETVARDVDFGASVIIAQTSDGEDILLAGQKSGTVWALDPDSGDVIWRQDFGEGSPLGGIHWGIAYDGEQVYAPINRPYGFRRSEGSKDESQKPGIHALDVDSGEVQWTFAAEPDCSGDRRERMRSCQSNIGLSGAPTVIDGTLVTGGLDGLLRVFDAESGEVLFTFDTSQTFAGANGIEGKGGSIDNASIVATNGYLFVNSGYGMFGQVPGNVMLAFKPKP